MRSASIQAAGLSVRLMKPGPATSTVGDEIVGAKLFGNRLGQLARLPAGVLGQHHGGVGRHVAVGGIARRLDLDARLVDAGRQHAGRDQRVVGGADAVEHVGKNVVGGHCNRDPAFERATIRARGA